MRVPFPETLTKFKGAAPAAVEMGTEEIKVMEGSQGKGKQEPTASVFSPFLPFSNITHILVAPCHPAPGCISQLPLHLQWHDIKVWPIGHNRK